MAAVPGQGNGHTPRYVGAGGGVGRRGGGRGWSLARSKAMQTSVASYLSHDHFSPASNRGSDHGSIGSPQRWPSNQHSHYMMHPTPVVVGESDATPEASPFGTARHKRPVLPPPGYTAAASSPHTMNYWAPAAPSAARQSLTATPHAPLGQPSSIDQLMLLAMSPLVS